MCLPRRTRFDLRTVLFVSGLAAFSAAGVADSGRPGGPSGGDFAASVQELLVAQQQTLETLESRLQIAADDAAALELQRHIERLKLDTEIELLRLQARRARHAGNEDAARRIEAAAAALPGAQEPPTDASGSPRGR